MTDAERSPSHDFLQRALWATGIVLLLTVVVATTAVAFYYAADLFFLIFAAILFAICLNRVSSWIASATPISRGWALGGVVLLILAAMAGTAALFGVQISQKAVEASKSFDEARAKLIERVEDRPQVRAALTWLPVIGPALEDAPSTDASPASGNAESRRPQREENDAEPPVASSSLDLPAGRVLSSVLTAFSTAFGAVLSLVIVIALTIYLAANPTLYRDGLIRLFPIARRDRVADLVNRLERTLWRWLLGRFAAMAITGTATGLILWLLGVPLPFTMGIVTGLLSFIPNVGPAMALAGAALLAAPEGMTTLIAVVALYLGMQLVESYVITPLIQKRQVAVPPAMLIAFQAFMGLVFGFLGLMVATPLLAAGMVIVNQLYVKDVLHDEEAPEMSA